MRFALTTVPLLFGLGAHAGVVHAEPSSDGYCDFVEGVAAAESSLLTAPSAFTQIGRLEQSSSSVVVAGVDPGQYRFIGGLRYRLSGLYEASAVKGRAKAECQRHTALEQ